MILNNAALWSAVIAGVFALAGNLVTAFGPSVLSWQQKPSFVDTETYKELKRDNPRMDQLLQEQLVNIESYSTYKEMVVEFVERVGDRIIVDISTISNIKNALNRELLFKYEASYSDETSCKSVRITDANMEIRTLDPSQFNPRTADDGSKISSFSCRIPPKGKIKIETKSRLKRPLWFEESLSTLNLVAEQMKVTVIKHTGLENLNISHFVLAPESSTLPTKDGEKTEIVIPGPVFPGQGTALHWKWNG